MMTYKAFLKSSSCGKRDNLFISSWSCVWYLACHLEIHFARPRCRLFPILDVMCTQAKPIEWMMRKKHRMDNDAAALILNNCNLYNTNRALVYEKHALRIRTSYIWAVKCALENNLRWPACCVSLAEGLSSDPLCLPSRSSCPNPWNHVSPKPVQ